MSLPLVYRSVKAVLTVLNDHRNENTEAVDALLEVYNNALLAYQNESHTEKRHPLIILEGLDGSGKSATVRSLTSNLKMIHWRTPPESICHIRGLFDNHPELRSAYYALGNYIAALEVSLLLKNNPVIIDRYFHSTCAFAIAQAVHDSRGKIEMPPNGDAFYKWPEDLLKPDAVLFLNVTESVRIERLSRRTESTTQENLLVTSTQFRNNVILAYKNMLDPTITIIDSDPPIKVVVRNIKAQIAHLFK